MRGIVSKSERVLLSVSVAFLVLLLGAAIARRPVEGVTVETARQASASEVVPVSGAKIDINTADPSELTELPGIGDTLAERIVTYRTEHGPFPAIEAIQEVSGIGAKKFEAIAELITVGSTAPAVDDDSGKGAGNG